MQTSGILSKNTSSRNLSTAKPVKPTTITDELTKNDIVKNVSIYLLTWLLAYYEAPFAANMLGLVVLIFLQLRSYQDCVTIMLLVIFIPFVGNLLGADGLSGMKADRLLFLVFLYYSLRVKPVRKLQINKTMFYLIIISIISLKFTSDLQNFVQDAPLTAGMTEKVGLKNMIASYFDLFIVLGFLYYIYTRLTFMQLSKLLNFLLLFAFLEGCCLLFLVYQNPSMVFEVDTFARGGDKGTFDEMYLWRNRYFGHKNDWGMMLVFILFTAVIRSFVRKNQRWFYIAVITVALMAILISLSRQALVWTVMGALILMITKRNMKFNIGFIVVMSVILISQPDFLMNRMSSMLTASSAEEFQSVNRKISELAINQLVSNFELVPRMFYVDWEYNYSEGFWNGMLHQQGILGLIFNLLLYAFIFYRFLIYYRARNDKLRQFGLLGMLFAFLMLFACFNRRSTHFLHYEGGFTQINFLILFIFTYIELINYAFRKRIINYERL